MTNYRIPLNLQFFADGGEGAGAGAAPAAATPVNTPAVTPAAPAPSTGAGLDVEAVLRAVEARTQRAEKSVLKSLADQYGLNEAEVTALLDKAKADKAKELPAEAKRQIAEAQEQAKSVLIAADVRTVGIELGLLDVDTALVLMDKSKVSVDGTKVNGTKEALEALKTAKPFLFKANDNGAWAQKQTGQPSGGEGRVRQMAKAYHEQKYGKVKE